LSTSARSLADFAKIGEVLDARVTGVIGLSDLMAIKVRSQHPYDSVGPM
jgi:hypothetical protein